MTTVPSLIADVLVSTGAVLAWVFVIVYSRRPWRTYEEGKNAMGFTLMVAAFLTFAMAVRLFGPLPLQQWIACALYAWMVYLLADRLRLLVGADRRDGARDRV